MSMRLRRTLMHENGVESHPEGWSQGRCLLSVVSLDVRLIWMPNGTLNCDHRLLAASTRVSFWTNRHLASPLLALLCLRRIVMQVVYARCAGLDVHKKSVVVCVRLVAADGSVTIHIRSFGTTTAQLLNLVAWLLSLQVTHVALESTGEF